MSYSYKLDGREVSAEGFLRGIGKCLIGALADEGHKVSMKYCESSGSDSVMSWWLSDSGRHLGTINVRRGEDKNIHLIGEWGEYPVDMQGCSDEELRAAGKISQLVRKYLDKNLGVHPFEK